jgi:hypothetical protein
MSERDETGAVVRSAEEALSAIASAVGCRDPFNPDPREVYRRVRRIVNEHERMRVRLVYFCVEADSAAKVLRDVNEADDE